MAPVADRGEKTSSEDAVNRSACSLEGTQTATRCKQQREEAAPELQALMVTAQRVKMKSSGRLVERRMGLSGLSRKPGFTSSKLLPVTENTEGITEHIPAATNPAGKPRARWPGRLEKQLPQRVSTRLLLLVSPERLFSRS